MLDRPLVPFAMAILWYLEVIPGPLAIIFNSRFRELSMDTQNLARRRRIEPRIVSIPA
jgi:hypothetical protein